MLTKAKNSLAKLHEKLRLEEIYYVRASMLLKDGKVDYSKDFFAQQAFFTVSGQLQFETYACALSSVYTFRPTFRAEQSHTSRHLAKFWMVELELVFADLQEVDRWYEQRRRPEHQ